MCWTVILYILGILITAFVLLSIVGIIKKSGSIYKHNLEQHNLMEGKAVRFVFSESDVENADGVKGHLEAIGESQRRRGFYETIIKRVLDIVLSFGGLVVLSPVFLVIILAILIDDPGSVFFTQKRVGQNKRYFVANNICTVDVDKKSLKMRAIYS